MQKVSTMIICLFLMSTVFSNFIYSENIEIGHQIESESEFSVSAKNITKFTGTTAIEICEVLVKNHIRH